MAKKKPFLVTFDESTSISPAKTMDEMVKSWEAAKKQIEKANIKFTTTALKATAPKAGVPMPEEVSIPLEEGKDPFVVEIPKPGVTPASASKEGKVSHYTAAKQIRYFTKKLEPGLVFYHTDRRLAELLAILEKPQSKRADRLQAAQALQNQLAGNRQTIESLYKNLTKYAQHLPTVPDLPQGSDENIVRAFIAILKSHGRIT